MLDQHLSPSVSGHGNRPTDAPATADVEPASVRVDPGSFRDPANRVFHAGTAVFRGLTAAGAEDWRALAASGFFPPLLTSGRICGTWTVDPSDVPAGLDDWPTVLCHERIPFVSHPYEWTYGMLRDAAALHLEILQSALTDGFTTKDGSAYNLQFRGSQPVFIDVGSFEPVRAGEPWAGYRQFCQTMLYPLLIEAHLGLDFRPWLRSRVDGIEPDQMRQLFRGFRRWRRGVPTHVHLHAALVSRNSDASTSQVRDQLRGAGFSAEMTRSTVRALARLVDRLDRRPTDSGWSAYQTTCTYTAEDRRDKEAFVEAALVGADRPALVLDLGANDGRYSRIAARHARYVVAVEQDAAVADRFYRELRAESATRILPLVVDLADPTAGGGWRGVERASFAVRARADVVLALAVVHHLAIGRNVPLPEVVDWLMGLLTGPGGRLVVEFVHPEDPMARRLMANKPAAVHAGYRRDGFERALSARAVVDARRELPGGTRTLYLARSRG